MANKYHRQGFKVGLLANIYKLDKTGKKDEIIESMNKRLKKEKKKIEQEPAELERYTDLMVSDFINSSALLRGRPASCNIAAISPAFDSAAI